MSCIFGENRDIFFPKLSESLHLISFSEIAIKFLQQLGYEPYLCESEDEARLLAETLPAQGKWPCLFTDSDTTGEKDYEEFFTENETLDMVKYNNLGVIKNEPNYDNDSLNQFMQFIYQCKLAKAWTKEEIVDEFYRMIPDFGHKETGKYLDGKM
jgi:hypothetical protein